MSKFGKKAISYWNWTESDLSRWDKTPKEIQLQLLEKWYPIGMKGFEDFLLNFSNVNKTKIHIHRSGKSSILEITGYVEYQCVWQLKVSYKTNFTPVGSFGGVQKFSKELHPLKFKPTDEFKSEIMRDLKLQSIFNSD